MRIGDGDAGPKFNQVYKQKVRIGESGLRSLQWILITLGSAQLLNLFAWQDMNFLISRVKSLISFTNEKIISCLQQANSSVSLVPLTGFPRGAAPLGM